MTPGCARESGSQGAPRRIPDARSRWIQLTITLPGPSNALFWLPFFPAGISAGPDLSPLGHLLTLRIVVGIAGGGAGAVLRHIVTGNPCPDMALKPSDIPTFVEWLRRIGSRGTPDPGRACKREHPDGISEYQMHRALPGQRYGSRYRRSRSRPRRGHRGSRGIPPHVIRRTDRPVPPKALNGTCAS